MGAEDPSLAQHGKVDSGARPTLRAVQTQPTTDLEREVKNLQRANEF